MFQDLKVKRHSKPSSKPTSRKRWTVKKSSKNINNSITDDTKQAIPTLPIEIILKIISKLTNFKDRLNCTLLSKDIRDLMFRSPKMIKNVNFRFKSSKFQDWKDFTNNKGSCMRNVVIDLCPNFHKIMLHVLVMLPNVEELELLTNKKEPEKLSKELSKDSQESKDDPEHNVELRKLKSLKINTKNIQQFIRVTKNVTNLKNLTVIYDTSEQDLPMYELICQQKTLKNLTILDSQNNNLIFPKQDISQNIKFRLKTFTLYVLRFSRENENLAKFLAVHAETLEELDFDFSIQPKVCEVILEKMTKLAKLTHRSDITSPICQPHPQNKSIKYIRDQNPTDLNIVSLTQKFQGLEHLKCLTIGFTAGVADCLKILEVDVLELRFFKDLELPNLEKLIVDDILMRTTDSIDFLSTAISKNFHLTIKNIRCDQLLKEILKNLNLLNKLLSLHIRSEALKIVSQNVTIQVFDWFFDIRFECYGKIFKVRTHSVEKCKKIHSFMADLVESELYKIKFELVKVDQFPKVGN